MTIVGLDFTAQICGDCTNFVCILYPLILPVAVLQKIIYQKFRRGVPWTPWPPPPGLVSDYTSFLMVSSGVVGIPSSPLVTPLYALCELLNCKMVGPILLLSQVSKALLLQDSMWNGGWLLGRHRGS